MNEPMWTLSSGVAFCTLLQHKLAEYGSHWYVGLTGSVLYGDAHASTKDIDIILYPTTTENVLHEVIYDVFRSLGMRRIVDEGRVKKRWRRLGSNDTKHVEVWEVDGRRVDVFFLQ